MIRLRTASALAAGAVAALALGGTALAAGSDDPSAPPAVEMLPDGTVVTPSPSASSSTAGPDPSPSSSSASPLSSPSSSSASSPSSAGAIDLDAAKETAVKAAGGGRVIDVERETEHGRAVWDIDVRKAGVEHDIDVDRATGEVLRHRSEADDDSDGRGRGGHGSDDRDEDRRDDDHGSDD
jgi:hypothetical protein